MSSDALEFYVRLPLLGDQKIVLYNESKKAHENYFKREIDRLGEISHLGIIHYVYGVPTFSRWDHVATMLTFIHKIAKEELITSSPVKLNNDVQFSSTEELLKTWAMLYSIGHLVGTFTTEHALFRYIVPEYKDEFIDKIKENLKDAVEEVKNTKGINLGDTKDLEKYIESIIEKEKLFKLFKIFTVLKIINYLKNMSPDDAKKFFELSKLIMLDQDYTKMTDKLDKKIKFNKIVSYFKLIRLLSFTLLDGYFSQNCVTANHYYFLMNLDKLINEESKLIDENSPYLKILTSLNLFYTSTLYQSPENSYYHHKIAKVLEEEIFKKVRNIEGIIENILNNKFDEQILAKIKEIANKAKKEGYQITGKRLEIEERLLDEPISTEKDVFANIFGGILLNNPGKYYEIDFYPDFSTNDSVFSFIESIGRIYNRVMNKLKSEFSEPQNEFKNKNKMLSEKVSDLLGKFGEVSKLALEKLMPVNPSMKIFYDGKKLGKDCIFFSIDDIDYIIDILNDKKNQIISENELKIEMEKSIDYLNKIREELSNQGDVWLIYVPNMSIIDSNAKDDKTKSEIDFLLFIFCVDERKIERIFAEIKKNNTEFKSSQIQKQLVYFGGLDESKSKYIAEKIIDEGKYEETLNVEMVGEKIDKMVVIRSTTYPKG